MPEDPSGKVTVKKTEGVKIVESDSDKADKNADVKKAIGDKIKAKLVHKAIKDDSDDDSSDSSDGHHKKIKRQQKKIKNAKAKSGKMKKALESAAKGSKHHKGKIRAQTKAETMTEAEILGIGKGIGLVNRGREDGKMQEDGTSVSVTAKDHGAA